MNCSTPWIIWGMLIPESLPLFFSLTLLLQKAWVGYVGGRVEGGRVGLGLKYGSSYRGSFEEELEDDVARIVP